MPTTAEYLNELNTQKTNLANNLIAKGITASTDETFNTLVPKVLEISGGESSTQNLLAEHISGSLTNITPDMLGNITAIQSYRFYNNTNLTSFDTGDIIETIGEYVFQKCTNLKTFRIGENVKTIGKSCLAGCTYGKTLYFDAINMNDFPIEAANAYGLVSQFGYMNYNGFTMYVGSKVSKIPAGLTFQQNVTAASRHGLNSLIFNSDCVCKSIGDYAFAFSNVTVSQLKSVSFSNNIKIIGNRAFYGNKALPSITFPNSLESIGELAFAQCKNLSTINFNGTMEQWNNITKSSDWNENVPAIVVHCSDGDVTL